MVYDIAIIGGGIVGCSIAMELSKYKLKTVLIEKENDLSMKTTKANSGIIHAGYDPKENTKMARLNVEGNTLVKKLQPLMNFKVKNIGSLVIGSTSEDKEIIDKLYKRGINNNVKQLEILSSKEEISKIEPNLSSDINYALLAKTAMIVSPWQMCLAFAYTAKTNGVDFKLKSEVLDISSKNKNYLIKTRNENIESKYVINCAGVHADEIYNMALKDLKTDDRFKIKPCIGEYYLLDVAEGKRVNHVVFQTPSKLGKGVLVSPTVHGNLIVGPNANYDTITKDYVGNSQSGLDYVKMCAKKTCANINYSQNIRNFAGVRATIEDYDDFLISESHILKNFINFAGIKSPGLSSGPAFGKELIRMLEAKGEKLQLKVDFKYYRLDDSFIDLSNDEKNKIISKDKRYGRVICRCQSVTEGEIVKALNMPIPASTLDGVKRRTNSGMGRCQGGFCGPKIFEIIQKQLHMDGLEIDQENESSHIVIEKTKGVKNYDK